MMRTKFKVAAVAASTALALGLVGCTPAGGGGSEDQTTITWWGLNQNATSAQDAIDQVIAAFEEENPTINVELETRDIDQHKEAMRTASGTDAAPDMYFYWAGFGLGGELVNAGASKDLTEYYDEFGWDERFAESSLGPITQYGGYHGVPWSGRSEALFYNKTLFEQAGIDGPPTTYDELVDAAEKLKAAGIIPMEFGGTVNWHLMRLLDNLLETMCGSETFDLLVTKQADWSSEPCVTETFTEFQLWTSQYLNEGFIGISNDEASALLHAGQAAMTIEGDWFNQGIRDNGGEEAEANFGIVAFPTGTGRVYGFTEAMYMSENTDVADETALFLDFLTNEDSQQILAAAFGSRSVNVNVELTSQSELDKAWDPIFEESTGLFMNNDQAFSLEDTTEYWRIQNLVATNELAPEDAGTEFQKFLETSG